MPPLTVILIVLIFPCLCLHLAGPSLGDIVELANLLEDPNTSRAYSLRFMVGSGGCTGGAALDAVSARSSIRWSSFSSNCMSRRSPETALFASSSMAACSLVIFLRRPFSLTTTISLTTSLRRV
jgi:hypothetical protein